MLFQREIKLGLFFVKLMLSQSGDADIGRWNRVRVVTLDLAVIVGPTAPGLSVTTAV
jgi:hypothetical protein